MKKSMLRLLTLMLSLALSVGLLPPMAMAAEIGDEIPIINPGFEEATSTEDNPGWSYMSQEQFQDITLETSGGNTGKNFIKIANEQGERHPWAAQTVEIPVPGSMYEVSTFINVEPHEANAFAAIKIEQYKENGDYLSEYATDSAGVYENTNNRWVEHKYVFSTSTETANIKIYLRMYNSGVAKFDDVKLTLSGGPEPYDFFADHVFHYPDEEVGNAYMYLNTYYAADSPEATEVSARFTIYDLDGETVLDQKDGVKFSGHEIKYTYPVSLFTVKEEKYRLKAELLDKNGEVIREWGENYYVYDRPLWMPDMQWRENGTGEIFNPIIAYHADIPSYDEVAAAGFNVVQTGLGPPSNLDVRQQTLDALEENNIKGLFCLYYGRESAAHPNRERHTRSILEALKDDPRVWAWAVIDEPLGAGVTPEMKQQLEDSFRLIRSIDKNHPIYIVDFANHKETAKYVDIFLHDTYSMGDTAFKVSQVGEEIQSYHTRLPIMELAASYEKNNIFPPMDTARGSVYRGLEVGEGTGYAGTGFYAIDDARGHDAWTPKQALYTMDVWPQFATFLKEEVPVLFEYYNMEGITKFNEHFEGELYKDPMWRTWFNEKGEMYLMAHNRGMEEMEFIIPLVSANGKIKVGDYKAEPIGLTRTGEQTGNGSIRFTLGKEEPALYKITPVQEVDLSNINASSFDDLAGDYAWAADAVSELQSLGIINEKGEGIFAPGEPITRGDLAGFLIRTLGFTSDSAENFADVPAEREYAKEIAIGKALGILQGVGDNLYNPEAPITRQDMMTICARGMKMAEKLAAADASVLDAFHDKENVADYALESVSAMIASGIIKGDDAGYLNPTGNTRRAEAAVIMQRILGAEKVEAGQETTPQEPTVENEVIEFPAPSEEALAKYNRSIALLQGLGTPAITPETSLTNGEAEAVLSAILGYAYDGLGENHLALTTQSAVEALVKLLGYEVYTARDGGFMGTASFIDLTKGVDVSGEYFRGGEFALLLENALGIYLADPTTYGESAEGRYVESDDTLLTRFRHLTLYKGVLEQNENTGLARGKVAVGTNLLDAGNSDAKNFIGQKVEAYTEGEDNTIVYIRANKNVKITAVDADKIDPGQTDMGRIVYEDENGHTKSITISGAQVLYNGKYKTNADVNTITPAQGTVTLIENGGSGADYIMVEKYDNFIVERIWAEDHQIFFKNRPELIWDETDNTKRLSMEGAAYDALKEWNVISLYASEDGSVMHAAVSSKNFTGAVEEISDESIRVGENTYKPAENVFGTIALGKEYTFLTDASGRIAGINDESGTENYAYFISIEQQKGVDGKVRIKVFTRDAEMKVIPVKDTVRFNEEAALPAEQLLSKTEIMSGTTPIPQLIILETAGEGENEVVTSIDTAEDFTSKMDEANEAARWSTFSYDYTTTGKASMYFYQGHGADVLGSKFLVNPGILHFIVPEITSDDPEDYKVLGYNTITHDSRFYDCELYDIDENQSIAVILEKKSDYAETIRDAQTAVITQIGKALSEDGEAVLTLKVMGKEEATLKFRTEDFRITATGCLTTENLSATILPKDLEVGDVIQYNVNSDYMVTGMSVVYRANHAPAEGDNFGGSEGWFYDANLFACGTVYRVLDRAFTLYIKTHLRAIPWTHNQGDAKVCLYEDGEVKMVSPEHIRPGDRVFFQRTNPYTQLIVLYR